MTTFKQQMMLDVEQTIHNRLEFAKDVTWYPGGNPGEKVSLNVVSFHDDLEGSREQAGDGRVLHTEAGTRVRESVIYEMKKRDIFTERYKFRLPRGHSLSAQETIVEDGKVYLSKRVISEDDDTVSVLFIASEPQTTRMKQRHE